MRTRLSRWLVVLAVVLPFTVASKCGEKPPQEVEVVEDTPAPPEVLLQVISIDPDTVEPDQAFRAVVFGSAFEDGAEVWIGQNEIAAVDYRDSNTLAVAVPPLTMGAYDVKVRNLDGETATLRAGLIARRSAPLLDCDLVRVPFDFDSAVVNADAQNVLRRKLPCFTEGNSPVRIEGHCDERGTTSYNLALGQRRADAIDRWLVSQGVTPSRLRAISYGEERPTASGHDESAWAQNRRGDLHVGK